VTTRLREMEVSRSDSLWDVVVKWDDICFQHILPRLNATDVKFLSEVNNETRKLIKRWPRSKENVLREMQANVSMNRSRCVNSECGYRRLSPTWSSFSNMESEFIHLWELAGITKTEEQVRDVLEHMLGTDVSAAMKNSEGVYLCLACKEKKFYQVRQAAYAEFLRRRRVERRDEDE